jgi:hypothetical protein
MAGLTLLATAAAVTRDCLCIQAPAFTLWVDIDVEESCTAFGYASKGHRGLDDGEEVSVISTPTKNTLSEESAEGCERLECLDRTPV